MSTLMTRTGRRIAVLAGAAVGAAALAALAVTPAGATPVAGCTQTATAVDGDTLGSIATKNNVAVDKLLTLNTDFDSATAASMKLDAGTKVCIEK